MKRNILIGWLGSVLVISGLAFFTAVSVQQAYRQGANDPQIQIAEDLSTEIDQGLPIEALQPPEVATDIAQSLSPFYIVYDAEGKAVASSAELDGETPVPPKGVLDAARENGQHRVTWQPRPDVRIAAVISPVPSASSTAKYVLAGRNLREVDLRVRDLEIKFFLTWIAAILVASLTAFLAGRPTKTV